MYRLIRLLFILAVLLFAYAVAVASWLAWPFSGIFWGLYAVVLTKKKGMRLTALGDARFATDGELARAGLLGEGPGMILGRAEESITLLQSRPGPRLSVRSRRIIAEWALVYGQVDKVIQQRRVLSEGQQDPGVRRALCSALLTKYKRKWISVPDGEL